VILSSNHEVTSEDGGCTYLVKELVRIAHRHSPSVTRCVERLTASMAAEAACGEGWHSGYMGIYARCNTIVHPTKHPL
jgi:hypothetical protein